MTRRLVAVLVPRPCPDGFPDKSLRLAMVEDVYETIAALELVEPVLALDVDDPVRAEIESLTWPGTAVVHLPPASDRASPTRHALDALVSAGADQVTVIAGDAPDMPGLLVGKLHRALGSPTSPCCRAPTAAWSAWPRMRRRRSGWRLARPASTSTITMPCRPPAGSRTSPYGRLARPGVASRARPRATSSRLDPGLEGWEITRELIRTSG